MKLEKRIPLWLKIAYTIMVAVILPVYWVELGPKNFLWFSDIALILMVPALWLEHRLTASTMAVAVLFLELAWIADFLSGGNLTEVALYMFTDENEWPVNLLSGLFHLALPPILLLMLYKYGYDKRAYPLQIAIALVVVPVTYLITEPEKNINWVYGLADERTTLPPLLYLTLLLVGFIVLVYTPSHFVFKRFFPPH
ncbi:membrane-associated protein [Pseudidiomarina insulisalsae]|uniref:Membrane-associated protein n=1 Tax=Pseudidiomarina insulisalsae TaxID=575789 RepID=A0A432YPQ5_9GAMM|nr:membrane-associated protein [Pseudidiomarina insulisalsae]RUO63110.1 membrane-associated protein [Pseudidiomarina insulisalsae]